MPHLAVEHLVIAYDFRGNGRSDKPDDPVSMATFVDDTVALLGHLGIPSVHAYGQSFGGLVAQEMALSHADQVRSLVLACTHAGPQGWDAWDRLGRIRCPTLVIHGTEDRLISVENARMLAERTPRAEFHLLEGAGHVYHSERPDEGIGLGTGRILSALSGHLSATATDN